MFEGASVSDKTRKRVLEAAIELGYRPNVYARSLITNQSKIIGLVMKSVQNSFSCTRIWFYNIYNDICRISRNPKLDSD
nr:LacI family DNA-binding transcriptional regulator [Sporosarcina ureae]